MVCLTSLMLAVAMVADSTPATAADPMEALLDQIQRAQDRKQFKRAADLAAPASQRTDLRPADRFVLAGLAAESYGDAFQHGGAPRQPKHDPVYLCAQRTVLQEASALADEPRKRNAVDDALGKVEAQLAQVVASGRDLPCALTPVGSSEAEPLLPVEAPVRGVSMATETATAPNQPPRSPGVATAAASPGKTVPTRSPADTRRLRAGVGTLVPGLLLFAPMAAVLAHRSAAERDLKVLQADSAGRRLTNAEREQVEAMDRRYQATTVGAAVLGATGAVLVVTGAVLLATGGRRPAVAVAPWGARGVGGLVLEGKF